MTIKKTQIYSSFLRRQEPSGLKRRTDTGLLLLQERRSNRNTFP